MLKDRYGVEIKEGDWIAYKYGEDDEIELIRKWVKNRDKLKK